MKYSKLKNIYVSFVLISIAYSRNTKTYGIRLFTLSRLRLISITSSEL